MSRSLLVTGVAGWWSLADVVSGLVKSGYGVATAPDTASLEAWGGFRPATPMVDGVAAFADWYRRFYGC